MTDFNHPGGPVSSPGDLARMLDDVREQQRAAMETLAVRLAKQTDDAVLAVLQRRGLTLDEAPVNDPEDVILWPCDTWCYRYELAEFSHKSDDYEVLRVGSAAWGRFMQREENP